MGQRPFRPDRRSCGPRAEVSALSCQKTSGFLHRVQHPLSEQGTTGPTIPHPFNELELIYKAFYLAVGMDKREPSKHSLFVSLKPFGKEIGRASCRERV